MKYIYAALVALFTTTGYGYDIVIPPQEARMILSNPTPVATQVMVYQTPYFLVTVPVPVTVPVTVAQPVQQTFYWGYPYQPAQMYYWNHRCKLFNFNY